MTVNNKKINKIKITSSQQNERAKKIAEDFESGRLFADPRFQREACWTIEDQRKYLDSLNMGLAQGPVTLCDLSRAEEFALRFEDTATQELLRKYRAEGKTDSVLDAQNRVKTLVKFFKGEVPIKGEFFGEADELVTVPVYTTYNKLPQSLQSAFRNAQMRVDRYAQPYSGPSGVQTTFVALNSGHHPSPQEVRNAYQTAIAGIVRDMTDGFSSWEYMGSRINEKRKKDEMLLNILLYSHPDYHNSGINKSVRDDFYKMGECKERGDVEQYSEKTLNRFKKVVGVLDELIQALRSNTGKQVSALDMWKMFYFSEYLVDAEVNYNQLDKIRAVKSVTSSYNKTLKQDNKKYNEELAKYEDANDNSVTSEPKQADFFEKQLTVPNAPDNRSRVRIRMEPQFKMIVNSCLVLGDDDLDEDCED